MPTYYLNEAVFSLPEVPFVDRTLHRLEAALPSGGESLSIEIKRTPIERGQLLAPLVDEDTEATKKQVSGFTLLDRAEVLLADSPAVLLRARYRARDSVYYQLKAHIALPATWIVIVVTGPDSDRAACDEAFDRIVQSVEWRVA